MKKLFFRIKSVIWIFSLLLSVHFTVSGQSRVQKYFDKSQHYFQLGDYKNAIAEAEKALSADPGFVNAALLLSDIYHDLDSVRNEIDYLEKALPVSANPVILVRLGEANYRIGEYAPALNYFEKYLETGSASEKRKEEIIRKTENCRFAIEAMQHPVDFRPEPLNPNINTGDDEYWPYLSVDQQKLVFTRLIKMKGRIPQEDLYFSIFDSTGWGASIPISDINTSMNEGAQVFSADEILMFFSACNRPDGKGSCDIYYSVWNGKQWSTPRNAGSPVNTAAWESQPGFSSDNRYLYFSSNRPGGFGNKDIWRIELISRNQNGDLKWGEPENLGSEINTPGDEISPFIHPNNRSLYFASDFRTGMGGFDLFVSEKNFDQTFSAPQNLGYPINTYKDEQGLIVSANGKNACFASTRNPNTGLDIYCFPLDEKLQPDPVTYMKANVRDKKTKQPVPALVELVKITGEKEEILSERAGKNGEIFLCLPLGDNYAFHISEEGYLFYSQSFSLTDKKSSLDPYLLDIELDPVEVGAEMELYNIYFETDSFTILPQSEPELQKLAAFLTRNPTLKVEIQGHTDNTGIAEKNRHLSELRAKSVVEYLHHTGIEKNRMQWKGYGAEKPVSENETPEGRRLNRRTTIKITGR